jgi:hypothetical protein
LIYFIDITIFINISYLPGMAWRKKAFRKYFETEEHFTEFHKMTHKLLEAPTEDIARVVQAHIVEWLRSVKETHAAKWFEKEWTGEHGNYTNASAGYVGNNKSNGCESHWKYIRRDTIGVAGSNKRMSISVWLPLLFRYLEALSKRHAEKLKCPVTGVHSFPTLPVITNKLWAKYHKFDVLRLLCSFVAGGAGPNKLWEEEWEFFLDMYMADMSMPFSDMMAAYQKAGKKIGTARSNLGAVYIPTTDLLMRMKLMSEIDTLYKAQNYAREALALYEALFDTPDQFRADHPEMSPMDVLQVMESFVRVVPLATKVGEMEFLCVCVDAYQCYACVESLVLSMLFNPNLNVPDKLREKQLKDREKAVLANPFTTKRMKEKKTKEQQAAEASSWKPKICSITAPQAGSAVAMALAKAGAKRAAASPVPAADAEEVMQRPVDPGLLAGKRLPVMKHKPATRPSVASLAVKKRVSSQVFSRAELNMTQCEPQRAASQPLELKTGGKKPRVRGGEEAASSQPVTRSGRT